MTLVQADIDFACMVESMTHAYEEREKALLQPSVPEHAPDLLVSPPSSLCDSLSLFCVQLNFRKSVYACLRNHDVMYSLSDSNRW